MSDQAVTRPGVIVGLFGKLPAHGDFVRRGLPQEVTGRLDDWFQAGFARAADPATAIANVMPIRIASTAIAPGHLALGAVIASRDRTGRAFPVVALRIAPHLSGALPDAPVQAWDDWAARAEALLVAARKEEWSADHTQAALETAARATVIALAPAPFPVGERMNTGTLAWRPVLLPGPDDILRGDGLPTRGEFDQLFGIASVIAA